MPILFDQDGKLNNLRYLLWTTQGSAQSAKSVITSYQGVNRTVWELDSPELFLTSDQLGPEPVNLYLSEYRTVSIYASGNGGAGGQSGKSYFGLYNGGAGGGGGPGGCIQIIIYPYNIDPRSLYIQFSRNRFKGQYVGPNGNISDEGLDVCLYRYSDNALITKFFITDGQPGGKGDDASTFNLYPNGGSGGAPGNAYYFDEALYQLAGSSGTPGYSGHWQDSHSNNGTAGSPVANISYASVQPDGTINKSEGSGNPIQIASQGWYLANRNQRDAFYSTDLNNICLGNAGAGGHNSILDGNLAPGTAGQGGLFVKYS